MISYPALIDGEDGAYGIVFPDIPGIAEMGHTVEEALRNAEDVLRDYAIETEIDGEELASPSTFESVETPKGSRLISVSLMGSRAEVS